MSFALGTAIIAVLIGLQTAWIVRRLNQLVARMNALAADTRRGLRVPDDQ